MIFCHSRMKLVEMKYAVNFALSVFHLVVDVRVLYRISDERDLEKRAAASPCFLLVRLEHDNLLQVVRCTNYKHTMYP